MNIKEYAAQNNMTLEDMRKITKVHHMKKLTEAEVAALDAYFALDIDNEQAVTSGSIEAPIPDIDEIIAEIAEVAEIIEEVAEAEVAEEVKPEWATDLQWKCFGPRVWHMKAIAKEHYNETK